MKVERCLRPTKVLAIAGKPRFDVDADLDHVRVCDCSICRRRGALLHRVEPHCLRVLKPIEELATYSFNTHTAKDYFCKTCGILPFRQPRTGPGLWSVNIRCLPDVDLGAIPIKVRLRKPPLVDSNQATAVLQNRPLRSETGQYRLAHGDKLAAPEPFVNSADAARMSVQAHLR